MKAGCDLFDGEFYERYFAQLDEYIQSGNEDDASFISILQSCESQIGHQKSYGEVKAFVLSQVIGLLYNAEAYIFCSDDFG